MSAALRQVRAGAVLAGALALTLGASQAHAQRRLINLRSSAVAPTYEIWTFSDGLVQPGAFGDSVTLTRAAQLSIPVAVSIPLGPRVTVDASASYATGEVRFKRPAGGGGSYKLDGVSDVRLRGTGRLSGDNVLFTVGLNLPTGKTSLNANELNALRVLAAPALNFATNAIGMGFGATTGLVLAKQIANWGWALGGSYEVRGKYNPVAAFAAGAPSPDYNPGEAIHLTLGGDGIVGQSGMTLGLSADFFTKDVLQTAAARSEVQLGPVIGAQWQLAVGATQFRELTFYASERYRGQYQRDGRSVNGTSGNYIDAGLRSAYPMSNTTDFVAGLEVHHQTGLDVDNSIATAQALTGGATIGLAHRLGTATLRPYLRGLLGSIDNGGGSVSARGISGGLVLTTQF